MIREAYKKAPLIDKTLVNALEIIIEETLLPLSSY